MGFWGDLFGTSKPTIKQSITATAVDIRNEQEKLGHDLLINIATNIIKKRFSTEKYGSTFNVEPKLFKLPKSYDNTYFKFENDTLQIKVTGYSRKVNDNGITHATIEIVADVNRVIRISGMDSSSLLSVKEKFNFDYNIAELIKLLKTLADIDPEFTFEDKYSLNLEQKIPKKDVWYTDGDGIYVTYDRSIHNRRFYKFEDWSNCTESDIIVDKVTNGEWFECDDPKKEHWEHFLRMEIAKKSKRANECIEYVLSIFAKEQKYSDIALTHGGNYFARIEDVETFNSFCKLVSETHYYKDFEIINALAVIKQNNLLHPKK